MKRKTIIISLGMVLLLGLVIAQAGGLFNVSVDRQVRITIQNDFGSIHINHTSCNEKTCLVSVYKDGTRNRIALFVVETGENPQQTRSNIVKGLENWMQSYHDNKRRTRIRTPVDSGRIVISDR